MAGDFVVDGLRHIVSAPKQLMVVDGARSRTTSRGLGVNFTIVVSDSGLHQKASKDNPAGRKRLEDLGFRLERPLCDMGCLSSTVVGDVASNMEGSRSSTAKAVVGDVASPGGVRCISNHAPPVGVKSGGVVCAPGIPYNRSLVQTCCEHDNVLNQLTGDNVNCMMINVTEYDDFTTKAGIQKAKDGITGPDDALWNASPCTGGSSLQFLNTAQWRERALEKIAGHYKLFRKLWASFVIVAEHAISLGAAVFIEWPRYCRYWKERCVQRFLKKHGFRDCILDGCMYGLTAKYGEMQGMPIKKPWRIACVNSSLPDVLNRTCDKSHKHCPCESRNTRPTQAYTPEIARVVHQVLADDAKVRAKGRSPSKACAVTFLAPCLSSAAPAAVCATSRWCPEPSPPCPCGIGVDMS